MTPRNPGFLGGTALARVPDVSGFGRPSRRRFTWLELALGAGIALVLLTAAAALFAPRAAVDEADLALRDGQRILEAAVEWREQNPKGCPTPSQLKHEHRLASDARTDDPWGGRYRVACSGDQIKVFSPGRDRKAGTPDDVTVPKS